MPRPVTFVFELPAESVDLRKAMIYRQEPIDAWKALPRQRPNVRVVSAETAALGTFAVLAVEKTFVDVRDHR